MPRIGMHAMANKDLSSSRWDKAINRKDMVSETSPMHDVKKSGKKSKKSKKNKKRGY